MSEVKYITMGIVIVLIAMIGACSANSLSFDSSVLACQKTGKSWEECRCAYTTNDDILKR